MDINRSNALDASENPPTKKPGMRRRVRKKKDQEEPRAPGPPYFFQDPLDTGKYPPHLVDAARVARGLSAAPSSVGHSSDDGDSSACEDNPEGVNKVEQNVLGDSITIAKVEGGRPAVARKITWNLDSDDELIVALKEEGCTDREVSKRLRADGRIDYHSKTINSRYRRIRNALERQTEREIDGGSRAWQSSDDEFLRAAVADADQQVEALKVNAALKKWELVSRNLGCSLPLKYYSSGACRKRFQYLQEPFKTTPSADNSSIKNDSQGQV
ncbi:MAG: Signal peptidase complex catalytic subunit [Chaenotheca gracillima]|nr:MAG: Signal peptidase complex catalytic subunit [Chaenotheca gracillima]